MTKTAISAQSSVVRDIPVGLLVVSPEETRKTIDQAALRELANSIGISGVIESLLVRSVGGAGEYEIVAGQRRWLASKLAGKSTCPCVVREMCDDEARRLRMISNLQREDLSAMEEAEAYGKLLDLPGATIETVAAALAKSPSYVGRRLKLLDAIEPVRDALKAGAIEVGHALELARLSERQQEELLDFLEVGWQKPEEKDADDDDDDDVESRADYGVSGECTYCNDREEDFSADGRTWANPEHTVCSEPDCVREAQAEGRLCGMSPTRRTVADLRSRIMRTELRVLRDVPFPLEAEIPPVACVACPKRAAGAASLFADIAEDTCTDPECLNTKLKVWVKSQLESADRDKRKLTMLYDGHAQDKAGVSRWDCQVAVDCASQESAIWVSGARIGHLVQICRDKKCPEHGAEAKAKQSGAKVSAVKSGGSAAAPKRSAEEVRRDEVQKAERAKLAAKVTAERQYRERLFSLMASGKVQNEKTAELLIRQACLCAVTQAGENGYLAQALKWPVEDLRYGRGDATAKRMQQLDVRGCLHAAALALCANEMAVGEYGVSQGQKPERMEQIAGWLGINPGELRAAKPAKKAASKPAKKESAKPAPKKTPLLSAAAKKRIAEAQKKRWAAAKSKAKKQILRSRSGGRK